jgi:glycosyltransferase involved in cell wall biosynthesis
MKEKRTIQERVIFRTKKKTFIKDKISFKKIVYFMLKIKVIHIIPQMELGGAERLLADITRGIDKKRFEIKIIVLYDLGSLGERLLQEDFKIYLIKAHHKFGFFSIPRIYRILKKENPDIVHTHLFGADVWGGIAAKLAGIKHLLSTEHNLNYDESGVRYVLKRFIIRKFEKIICISDSVSLYLENIFGIGPERKIKIFNGIDADKYDKPGREAKSRFIIGSLGRLTRQKGYDILIEVLRKLDFDFECRIIGTGELEEELLEQIKNHNMEKKIKLLGKVNNVENFYNELDVYLQPSRWEGLCLAVLEAGASGLPVIASNVDGLREIIDDKENGFLVNMDDLNEVVGKINYIREHKAAALSLGENLRKKVKEKFTLESMVKNYENLYEKV